MPEYEPNTAGKVAIIGLSLRVPGAENEDRFWHNLAGGIESIGTFSDDEIELDPNLRQLLANPEYVKRGAVLENIDMFDAELFGCSSREAQLIDPQHRLFMQACWEALENAGYNTETYPGSIGLYAGAGISTYLCLNVLPNADLTDFALLQSIITANDKDYLCSRVAYKLNLSGPAVTIQTACSTSLVAVHFACQSVLSGECDMALAGGVSVRVPQKSGYIYQEGGILSPDGHCRPFDARACGTVPANGLGVVVVKRLGDALADGDNIRAVILGSAINNDGSKKAGFMAPSVEGQASVISEALGVAHVTPDTIGYVEAHGTGTELGDPIEVRALNKVFHHGSKRSHTCALGSVKGNLGHLDTAAGVIGLIKSILCLNHRMLPPTLHFGQPNSKLNLADTPFYVNNTLELWKHEGPPLRAGISSFGIGGTNAHVVVEEAPTPQRCASAPQHCLLLFSAHTTVALDKLTENIRRHIANHAELDLADVAYTLQVGRRALAHRRILLAHNRSDVIELLTSHDAARVLDGAFKGKNRSVSFLFPDHGSEYLHMAGEWYASVTPFREAIDACSGILNSSLGLPLRDLLYPQPANRQSSAELLAQQCFVQPALFSVEYALARTLIEWGLRPEAMMGQGVGEYAAACISGVLSLETALAAVAARGRLSHSDPVRVSGLDRLEFHQPSIAFISNVTGTWITNEQATDPEYWFAEVHKTARLTSGVATLLEDADSQLIELGPGSTLCQFVLQNAIQARQAPPIALLRDAGESPEDLEFLWHALGRLWLSGVSINWAAVHSGQPHRRVPLPTYPFQCRSYWIPAPTTMGQPRAKTAMLSAPVAGARPGGLTDYVPARTETEVQLVQIWEDVLGYRPVGVHDDFFDLGGDSLIALQIGSRIHRMFPGDVPLQKLAHASTVEQLAELIDGAKERPATLARPSTGLGAIFGASPLVPLHMGKPERPFFCVHPVGGTVLCYIPLARRLGPEQTFYGIQAPSIYGGAEPSSIEGKSEYYIELIRQIQPRGPYLIGGHSYGGNVAFEIASQLVRSGDHVSLLALLDSYPPEAYLELPPIEQFREAFPHEVASYFNVEAASDEGLPSVVAKLQGLYPDLTLETVEHVFNIWISHFRALQQYRPQYTYPGRITYFRCHADPRWGIVDLAARNLTGRSIEDAWGRLSSVPLEVYAVPGDHSSLLRTPHIDVLAALLREVIERLTCHSGRADTVASGSTNAD